MSSTEAAFESGETVSDVNSTGPADTSSTTAEPGVETTLLDAVTTALNGPEESPPSEAGEETSSADTTATETSTEGEGEEPDLTEEEMKRLSTRTQNLIRRLKSRDKEYEALRPEVEQLRPKAGALDAILSYMETHGIETQEFDNSLEITRLIKAGEYTRAFDVLAPIYQELAKRAGKVLPDDLAQQVRQGYITEAHARELHESRTRLATAEQRQREAARRAQEERVHTERQAVINTAADFGTQWDLQKQQTDPDWKLKQPLVAEQVELELRRLGDAGYPRSKEAVGALLEKALATVEGRFRKTAPRPVERRTPSSQPVSSGAEARPLSLLDAVKQGVARANAG